MDTPIVIIIYNRYGNTLKLIQAIEHVAPKTIFVIADGPKLNSKTDKLKCQKVRSVIDNIKWKCSIHKIFSDINLGLENRIVTGLDSVFSIIDRAIILEDDCIPQKTYFRFCEELLDKYQNNPKVAHIGGSKFINEIDVYDSYYFSKYSLEWGWATWKDRWERYDSNMVDWPSVKNSKIFKNQFSDIKTLKYWNWIFDNCHNGNINSWAYKWKYKNISQCKLSIVPKCNLIRNIGMGLDSTNTKLKNKYLSQDSEEINYPLQHPQHIINNNINDKIQEGNLYSKSVLWLEIITKRIKPTLNKFRF